MTMPARLGKYPIASVIGKGSMGVVYRGIDPDIKRPVAIKTIRKDLLDDDKGENMSERFRREAQAAGALNHPGIVAVYEYGEDAGLAFIAMEFVEGDTLREYMARGASFDEHDSVSIMAQLLDALQFAHEHAVWHRDIKPANIMVMRNGRIKLTDFGIARIESTDFTKTNVVMGTPGFIAPELYLGRDIDQRVDIFSAGVLFYHLLAGKPPFYGRPEAVMHDVCYHDPAPPSTIDAHRRWPQYDAVVARALEKSPSARFQTAAAFRAAVLAEYAQPLNSTLSDATIIPKRGRRAEDKAGAASIPPASSPPSSQSFAPSIPPTMTMTGGSTPPPAGWTAPVLAGVEVELARFVGPVARVLVRRAAQVHKDVTSLTAAVIDSIERPEDREAFARAVTGAGLSTLRARSAPGIETPVPAPGTQPPISAADIERVTRLLTSYIGPIARVVVKRAATDGVGRDELTARVAQSVEGDSQRERFMRQAATGQG
jgi:eukaryotic-like serine/threonine-protein kinase